jgi:hypothetical protein
MQSMNQSLEKLVRAGRITLDEALRASQNPDDLKLKLSGIDREQGYDVSGNRSSKARTNVMMSNVPEAKIELDHGSSSSSSKDHREVTRELVTRTAIHTEAAANGTASGISISRDKKGRAA